MEYEIFNKILLKLKESDKKRLSLSHYEDLHEDIIDEYSSIITYLFKAHYGEEMEDLISWWLYEDVEKVLYYKNDKVANILKSTKQLWEYVEKFKKSSRFKSYKLPKELTSKEKKEKFDLLKNIFGNLPKSKKKT